ncbi:MAG: YqgE/AlgH family protein [Pseudomonadota bacterium]
MSEPDPTHAPPESGTDEGGGPLEGALLVAMPGMGDPRFFQTVIYLCAHGEEGAMGLIINKRARELTFAELLKQVGIEGGAKTGATPVHFGGPVEVGRGFVLHTDDWEAPGVTKPLPGGLALTATVEILRDMAAGKGPDQAVLALGYAGWSAGQLEVELQQNGWLTCDADPELIFGPDDEAKWTAALRKIGVDPAMLSSQGGMA